MKTVKQATRGQELIHRENCETLQYYGIASLVGVGLFVAAYSYAFETSWQSWAGFVLSALAEVAALLLMYSGTKCTRGPRGQIIDAGVDLSDPQGICEYCKDVIILCILAHLLSLISTYFLLILLAIPAFAVFQLWQKVIGPWFFAEAPEPDAADEKKLRRKQKVVYRR